MSESPTAAELRGHYRTESGQLVPGRLYLRRDQTGWYDPEMDLPGFALSYATAQQFLVTQTIIGVEITGCGGKEFLPDDGECERIGLPIKTLS